MLFHDHGVCSDHASSASSLLEARVLGGGDRRCNDATFGLWTGVASRSFHLVYLSSDGDSDWGHLGGIIGR